MRTIARSMSLGVAAAASLLWSGAAFAQTGPGTGGMVGGPSDSRPNSVGTVPAPERGNTPSTGGGLTTQSGKDTATSTSSTSKSLTGEVAKVDKKDHTVSIKGTDQKLKVDPTSTQVMRNGSQASIDDIKEGDQVRASFSGTGSQIKVNKIDVLSSGGAGSSSGSMGGSSSGTGSSSQPGSSGSSSGSSPSGSSGSSSRGY